MYMFSSLVHSPPPQILNCSSYCLAHLSTYMYLADQGSYVEMS